MKSNIFRQFRGEVFIELSGRRQSSKTERQEDLLTIEYGFLRLMAKNASDYRRASVYENMGNNTQIILFGWANDRNKGKLGPAEFSEAYENHRLKDFLLHVGGTFFLVINEPFKTVLVTSRFGNIPLFIFREPGEKNPIRIATRLAFLLDYLGKRYVDVLAGLHILKYGYCLGNRTLVENIEVLSPATVYSWDGRRLTIDKYWRFWEEENGDKWDRPEDWYHGFRQTIDQYVGEENINLGLSGGLDTRFLLGTLMREKKKIHSATFCGETESGDREVARKLAQRTGIEHEEVILKPSTLQREAKRIIDANSGISINASLSFWELGKHFAESSRKLIHIANAEIFWGSRISQEMRRLEETNFIPYLIQKESFFDTEFLKRFFEEDSLQVYSKAEIEDIHQGVNSGDTKDPYRIHIEWDFYQRQRRFIYQNVTSVLCCWVDTFEPHFGAVPISLMMNIPSRERLNRQFQRRLICKLFPDLALIPEERDGLPIRWKLFFRGARSVLLRTGKVGKILIDKSSSYSNFDGAYHFFQNWWQMSDGKGIRKTIEEIDWVKLGAKKNIQFEGLYKETCVEGVNGYQLSSFLYNLFTIATGMVHWNLSYPK
jgi:hypothetical protein